MASTPATVSIEVLSGSRVRVKVVFQAVDTTTNADPTAVAFKVLSPLSGATATTYTYGATADVVKDGVGLYHLDVIVNIKGNWTVQMLGTGATGINAVVEIMIKCDATVIS